jgi:hypothetical protein
VDFDRRVCVPGFSLRFGVLEQRFPEAGPLILWPASESGMIKGKNVAASTFEKTVCKLPDIAGIRDSRRRKSSNETVQVASVKAHIAEGT